MRLQGWAQGRTIITTYDMTVLNDPDRFHLVLDVLHRLPQEGAGISLKQIIEDKLREHKAYIDKHGEVDNQQNNLHQLKKT